MTASRWSRPAANSCCAASAEGRSRSVGPGEGREMPVIALAGHVEVEPETVHMQVFGARQREAPVGGVCRVVDVIGLAAAIARGHTFDLEGEQARRGGTAGQP